MENAVHPADGLVEGVELATKVNGKVGGGTTTNDEAEKEIPVPDRLTLLI